MHTMQRDMRRVLLQQLWRGRCAALRHALPWSAPGLPASTSPCSPATPTPSFFLARYAYPLTCTGFSKDSSGRVTEVQVGAPARLLPSPGAAGRALAGGPGRTKIRARTHVDTTGFPTPPALSLTGNCLLVISKNWQATYDPDFASKKPPKGVLNW